MLRSGRSVLRLQSREMCVVSRVCNTGRCDVGTKKISQWMAGGRANWTGRRQRLISRRPWLRVDTVHGI